MNPFRGNYENDIFSFELKTYNSEHVQLKGLFH